MGIASAGSITWLLWNQLMLTTLRATATPSETFNGITA